ncbi:MAG: 1-(5-phosphoribosyl)-5-[(5-phosphoribosylamino)methylideneamino]imidazole-4-carboxamide isomerase [Bacteroidetes bacterium HGW-Bacteroidetes-1]|nr:MAG: 1-(5-phosphoribosyl)-5-[(5-phosphoribosylamino)methylideneamino]imidazole-4-carboxamide isomerase [Bacteroidetes bacterium HGW-Bacteroidetes-1]
MIEIIPAIDLIGGQCVRLEQGRFERKKVYDANPLEVALRFAEAGCRHLHIVDLDGARFGAPLQLSLIEKIIAASGVTVQSGGGIQTEEAVESAFKSGIKKVIMGTVALRKPYLMERCLLKYGGEQIVLSADVLNDKVMVSGWQEGSEVGIKTLIDRFLPFGLLEIIATDINRDGMLNGPAVELYSKLKEQFPTLRIVASGGVSSIADIKTLNENGVEAVVVGKAIYEGRISLEEIMQNGYDHAR